MADEEEQLALRKLGRRLATVHEELSVYQQLVDKFRWAGRRWGAGTVGGLTAAAPQASPGADSCKSGALGTWGGVWWWGALKCRCAPNPCLPLASCHAP